VDAILTNPRYTGRQVWNRQRKREVLLDVEDVALWHVTKMSWNPAGEWVYSEQVVHSPIIDDETFSRAQRLLKGPGRGPREHAPHRLPARGRGPARPGRLARQGLRPRTGSPNSSMTWKPLSSPTPTLLPNKYARRSPNATASSTRRTRPSYRRSST